MNTYAETEDDVFAVRHATVTHSPLHGWLREMAWNWRCEECQAFEACEHDGLLTDREADLTEDFSATLCLLDAIVSSHQSSSAVVEALGGDSRRFADPHCTGCGQRWPCRATVEANKSAKPLLDAWLLRQEWWVDREWLGRDGRRGSRPESLQPDGRVMCSYCGEDVTVGVEEWRTSVNTVFSYVLGLQTLLADSIDMASRFMPEEFRYAEQEGLRLARCNVSSQFSRLLYSHHEHMSFVEAERAAGRIHPDICL